MVSYAIVVFPEEQNGVAMVPEEWCIGFDRCYWPPYKSLMRFEKAVKSCEPHRADWNVHKIRILSITDSYDKARTMVRRAEDTSDLKTDADDSPPNRKRQRRPYSRYIDPETTDEETDETGPRYQPPPPMAPLGLPGLGPSSSTAINISERPVSSPVTIEISTASSIRSNATPERGIQPTATERLLLKLLTEIKSDVREVKTDVRRMRCEVFTHHHQEERDGEYDLPDGIVLPCSTMEQLEELDRQLKINRELHRHLLSILSATGGKRLREVIRRMMTELITNEVAKKTNWTGQGGKTSFSALALRALVEKAVRRNSSTAGCSNAEVGYFLKGASDRDGGRQARRQPAQPQPEVAAEQ